eukprot:tig00001017_g6255.t1
MERRRSKRLRNEAPTDAAGGAPAPELSALEALHPDALEAVLLRLGLVEAWRSLRPVSRAMRAAVDRVAAWPALRLKADTVEKLQLAAARFARDQPRKRRRAREQAPRITLAAGAAIELITGIDDDGKHTRPVIVSEKRIDAISALFSACSASSGGLGSLKVSLQLALDLCRSYDRELEESGEKSIEKAILAALDLLSRPEAEGGSRHTLRSVSVQLKMGMHMHILASQASEGLVQLLSRFPRLERLELPYLLDSGASNSNAAVPAALPTLRSAVVCLRDGAALARLAFHPALEELDVSVLEPDWVDRGPRSGFDVFAAGPAAARLRKLKITFTSGYIYRSEAEPGFDIADLPSLRHLTSLEALELNFDLDCDVRRQELHLLDKLGAYVRLDSHWRPEPPDWLARGDHETLAGLRRLRILDLDLFYAGRLGPAHLRCLARSATELCAHSLTELRLKIFTEDEAGVDAALAELLRAAAPALVELGVGAAVLKGEAAAALAACPRLERLELVEPGVPDTRWEPVPIAEAVDAVIACPCVKVISGFIVPFSSEREAAELLGPLSRLAASRAFDCRSCSFTLRPRGRLCCKSKLKVKAVKLAKKLVHTAFPKAAVKTPDGTTYRGGHRF